ncbi:MAG TPA: TonB-dependent receptor [Bacteroidales bacterium]|nr:TonB-dependent receptor [Bacteroidales bacterium]
MRKFCFILPFLLLCAGATAQQSTIKGKIINTKTRETLPGVNIILDSVSGFVSDTDGNYSFTTKPGKTKLTFSFIGYTPETRTIMLNPGQSLTLNVSMSEQTLIIDGIVVSAGKFEQRISDVTVSMDVIKPEQIENHNTNDVTEILNKVPGVDIIASQPSIRGGSGYSYGTGNRVLVMVDDLPILSPDAGDAKWNFIPIENISQIEVLKGASSALFGSSALNGVINVRTAFPTDKPKTKILFNSGIYMNPKRKELIWWGDRKPWYMFMVDEQPWFSGLDLLHSRKIKNLDLVIGANGFTNQDFKQFTRELRGRANLNLRYRPKKVEGLSFGVNTNFMYVKGSEFFFWQNADSGAWRPNPNTLNPTKGYRLNTDPYVVYFDKKGSRYSLKTRYFRSVNFFSDTSDKNNTADLFFGDFQYQKSIKNKVNFTAGISGSYNMSSAALFGNHLGINLSVYSQFDATFWKKLSISLGIRGEYYRLDDNDAVSSFDIITSKDTIILPVRPVIRAGVNYQATKYTFIRASYGQGYRFPSIAERYVHTSIGGMNIFPNTDLKPETGWNAELGVKQGFKVGSWNGFADIAGFWTEYKNMVEFTFGVYKPDTALYPTLRDIGFKSINVGHALITGVDISIGAEGKIWEFPASFAVGYTYTNPVDLNYDPSVDTNGTADSRVLKYRYYHSVKANMEISFNRIQAGVDVQYTSNMINIDKIFGEELIPGIPSTSIMPGLNEYREKHNKGYFVMNIRGSFDITEKMKIGLIVKNLLNNEYMARPGIIEAPRNIAVQYSLTL